MTRTSRTASTSLTASISLALAYALLISLCAPFTSGTTTRRATAAATAPLSRRIAKRSRSTKAPQTITKKKGGHRDGELLARFRSTASPQDINALLAARSIARTGQLRGASRIERLTVPTNQDPEIIAAELRTYPIIDFVEPNYLISKDDTTPNDPQFPEQWALHNTGTTAGHAGADIGVIGAWDTTTGSSSTVIAVIDSGIDFSHPDLANNQWTNAAETKNKQDEDHDGFIDDTNGWDFVADSPTIKDEAGHGTAVAGLIAAEGNNGTGIAGVMWKAQLMNLRVLDKAGTGDVASAVEAIDYATAHGVQVINLSWGTDEASLALKDTIQRADRRNIVVVCSAGNDARDVESAPYYPASFDLTNLISVAATDNQDTLAAWSNAGQTHITIAAPGVDVLTTKTGKGYQTISGTSASAPLVAGVAGLVKTLRPQLSAAQTKAMIVSGARSVAALAGKVSAGGVVDAAKALQAMSALPPSEGVGSNSSEASNTNSNNGGNAGNGGTTGSGTTAGSSSGKAGGNSQGVGNYTGRPHAVPSPPERGAPGLNLPNLDVERKRPHHEPHVPASTHPDLQEGAPARHSSALPSREAYPVLAYSTGDQYHRDLAAAMKNAAVTKSNEHALFNSLMADVSFDDLMHA